MDPHTAELVTRSISFGEHRAADAMVPRPLVTFLRDHTAQDLLDTVAATGRSRFPVLGGTVDAARRAAADGLKKLRTTRTREELS